MTECTDSPVLRALPVFLHMVLAVREGRVAMAPVAAAQKAEQVTKTVLKSAKRTLQKCLVAEQHRLVARLQIKQ